MLTKSAAIKPRSVQAAPVKSGNARTVQRKILPSLRVLPQPVQRKERAGSWMHQQPLKAVNSRPLIQPKVTIHAADDHFEKEADHVADKVIKKEPLTSSVRISRIGTAAQRKPIIARKTSIQAKTNIQRSSSRSLHSSDSSPPVSGEPVSHPLTSVLSSQSTRGSPLPQPTRSLMESRMGADFSNVRIHTGQESHDAGVSIGARAFTNGANIHFANGQYSPGSRTGQHLLAHELTHTIQQGASPSSAHSPATIQRSGESGSSPSSCIDTVSGRGPPLQKSEAIVQCSLVDTAVSRIGELLNDLPSITEGLEGAKRWLMGKLRRFASFIPGYTALGVVLGQDPITGERIERNGRNFIEAALDIIPAGNLLKQKLEELGAIDRAAAWIDTQIETLSGIIANVRGEFTAAWDRLGIGSILDGPLNTLRTFGDIFERAINSLISFAGRAASELLSMVKEFLLTQLVNFIKNHTTAYELLKVIIGKDPITDEPVARNGTNILNALLELGGEQGREQRRQMQDTGTFQKAADWIDRGIAVFGNLYQTIRNNFGLIWNSISIQALMHPVDTFNRIYETFAAPVRDVLRFVEDALRAILALIKEVLLQRLSAWARTVRGYHLVTVLIGKDPFTNQPVPRTIPNIIRGFMSLMEGGEEQYRQMEESGAIARTTQRINAAVARLNMTPAAIVQLFIDLWNSFSFNDLAHPVQAFQRIINRFGEPVGRLIAFVVEIVKIVIEVILQVMNFPFDLINNIITRSMAAFERIKRDPVSFIKNLLRAIKQGFIQFFDNIVTHLINGVVGWLMSELRDANIPELRDFSLRGVISWVLQVLGISMEAIWQKLAAHPRIGPERVARIRSMIDTLDGIWTFIRDVQQRGMAAIWDKIQEQLTNLWNTVLDAVKNWIMERIISQVTARLLSMLDPTGIMAVINSAIAIYRAVQSFIRYLRQMLEVVNSFVNGVADIAEGNVSTAANYLERTMGRAMPIVIGFLANQVGLSGIGRRIGEMITQVRQMVDRALTWLVNRAVDTGFAVIDRLMSMGRSAVGAVREAIANLLGIRKDFRAADNESHQLYFTGSETSPELMVASANPRRFREFIAAVNTSGDARKDAAKTAALPIASELDRILRTNVPRGTPDEQRVQRRLKNMEVQTRLDRLAPHVAILMEGQDAPTGRSRSEAIPLTWYKPRSEYARSVTLEDTRRGLVTIPFGQRRTVEPDMERFTVRSTEADVRLARNLIEGGAVNVGATNIPDVSNPNLVKNRSYRAALRTEPQRGFRSLCILLGYDMRATGEDADHVVDLQFEGHDGLPNLWPLRADVNRSALRFLNQVIRFRDDSGNIQAVPLSHDSLLNRHFKITAVQLFTKMKTGGTNDQIEREADHISDKVVSHEKIDSPFNVSKASGTIHRKAATTVKPAAVNKIDSALHTQSTRGSPLPGATRTTLEKRMSADFSNVRVHTDAKSEQAAAAIGARAFTQGANIHFAKGEFNPQTKSGQRLLAHELVHTMQQGVSPSKKTPAPKGRAATPAATTGQTTAPARAAASPKAKKEKGKAVKENAGGEKEKAGGKKEKKRSPSKPEEDPAFQQTIRRTRSRAKDQRSHVPASEKADDAQNAATAVPNEAQSKAQSRKTDGMDAAGKKNVAFDAEVFKSTLLARIEEITPKSLEEADDFKENNRIHEVKAGMNSQLAAEKQNTMGPVTRATAQPLQVNDAENKKPVTLPPTEAGAKPASVGGRNAAPKKKTDDEISMQEQSASLDEEMKQNNVTEDQLQGSNEPSFQSALKEKKNAQKDAAEKPLQYRKAEAAELKAAEAEAGGKAASTLAGMHGSRIKNFEAVVIQQGDSKKKDEDSRAKVAQDINDKYALAEKNVNEHLTKAETRANELFEKGSEDARRIFEDHVDRRMRVYKADRYSGLLGGGRWLKDKLFDMPEEVNVFYVEGKDMYLKKMDSVITEIANVVTEKLNSAKKAIEDGKKEIDNYVKGLPDNLIAVGKEAADSIQDKFDTLEQSVNDKAQQLIDGLAKKYVDNVKKLDERITELKEANKGLVSKAIGMLKAVWNAIKNIYNLFRTILSKLVAIVGVILGAPGKFFGNLGAAFSKGFDMFKSRLDEHLENGLMIWLSTQLGVADLKLPPKFDVASIFAMVLQVMGINYTHIREKAVIQVGEERVALMESTAGLFQRIHKEGLGVIWDIVYEKFTDFKQLIWEAIKTFIRDAVIKAAITFLLSLLNPVAAFIKACMAIYDFLMMLVKMKDRIIDLLNSILDAVMTIAHGSVDAAAAAIEKAFAKSIPIIIGFLAALLHLNNIGSRVRDLILRIRARVDKLLDWMIGKAYALVRPAVDLAMRAKNKGKELLQKGKEKAIETGRALIGGGGTPEERLHNALSDAQAAVNRFAGKKVGAMVLLPLLGAIKLKYGLQSLEPVRRGNFWAVKGVLNPQGEVNTDAEVEAGQATNTGLPVSINVGESIFDKKYQKGYRVSEINVKTSLGMGLKVEGASGTIYLYDQYGTRWEKPAPGTKPPFVGFSVNGTPATERTARIVIDHEHLNTGTAASVPRNLWTSIGYDTSGHWSRAGHLVPNSLGGPGAFSSGNIVPMTFDANQTNKGMRDIEDRVLRDIKATDAVYDYSVKVNYKPSLQLPPVSVVVTVKRLYPDTKLPDNIDSINPKTVDNT